MTILLKLDRLSCHFQGVRAVDDVSFDLHPGLVYGLIGPNGAGKTTLINMVSGLQRPTGGSIWLGTQRIDGWPAHRIAAAGIARTYQNIRLFPRMSALANVEAGQHLHTRTGLWQRLAWTPGSRAEEAGLRDEAAALLAQTGLAGFEHRRADELAYGQQRRLELARALAIRPRLLLLDEPAAGMNHAEIDGLGELIRSLATGGRTIVLIEHNVGLVMSVCDHVFVLDFGHKIAEGPPEQVSNDPAVITAYLGGVEAAEPEAADALG